MFVWSIVTSGIRSPAILIIRAGTPITVELAGSDGEVASLLEQLMARGVRLRSFAEKDPTLEDVFMMVTKGLVT